MAIDKIGSAAITDCTVVAADIAPGTVTNAKLAGSIANAKLANSSVTINGTSISLGASGSIPAVSWQSVVVSDGSTVTTMVAGRGYFIDNTSAAGLVSLPSSASAGDTIAIKDYAGNFGTNALTIQRNSHKIQGNANDSQIKTNRASVTLVYVDATKGWLYANESNVADLQQVEFVAATGGTVATSGNFKIHSFTGDGCFVVSNAGNSAGSNTVDYLVVAGGGGGGGGLGGGGGAGGHRESSGAASGCYTVSPLGACVAALSVTATTFPITVGAGGEGRCSPNGTGVSGSNSVFSTITSAGGGGGGTVSTPPVNAGASGGSGGGGAGQNPGPNPGAGNTPPVSPPQGTNGGIGDPAPGYFGGGGGGAIDAGSPGTTPSIPGKGGDGATNHITGSPVTRAGGGSGGGDGCGQPGGPGGGGKAGNFSAGNGSAATANTGGGGGAGSGGGPTGGDGAAGGKGIVIIRYKFQ